MASGVVFWFLAARLASTEAVGLAASVASTLAFIGFAAQLGINVSILEILPRVEPEKADRFVSASVVLVAMVAAAAAIVFSLGTPLWAPQLSPLGTDLLRLFGYVLLAGVWTTATLLDSVLMARRRSDLTLVKNAVHAVLRIALIGFVLIWPTPEMLVLASFGSVIVSLTLALSIWLPRLDPPLTVKPTRSLGEAVRLLPSALPNYLVTLAMAAPQPIASLVVLHELGPEAAAIFYIVWMLSSVSMIFPSAFGYSALVELSHARSVSISRRAQPFVMTLGGSIVVLLGAIVLLPFFGAAYGAVGPVTLLPYCFAALPGLIYHSRMAELRAQQAHRFVVTATLMIAASFTIGLSILPTTLVNIGWLWLGALTLGAGVASLLGRRSAAKPPRHDPSV